MNWFILIESQIKFQIFLQFIQWNFFHGCKKLLNSVSTQDFPTFLKQIFQNRKANKLVWASGESPEVIFGKIKQIIEMLSTQLFTNKADFLK